MIKQLKKHLHVPSNKLLIYKKHLHVPSNKLLI